VEPIADPDSPRIAAGYATAAGNASPVASPRALAFQQTNVLFASRSCTTRVSSLGGHGNAHRRHSSFQVKTRDGEPAPRQRPHALGCLRKDTPNRGLPWWNPEHDAGVRITLSHADTALQKEPIGRQVTGSDPIPHNTPMIVERRHHPRIYRRLPAEILLAESMLGTATILNISRGGAQLECLTPVARSLMTPTGTGEPYRPVELCLRAQLPIGEHPPTPLLVRCRVVVPRRVSADTYHVGLQFIAIEPEHSRLLERYVEDNAT